MDHRPGLTAAVPAADPVLVDQAIFTSVPSPMGEGYRIIAASPGVHVEEKAELTRRAPSHASLSSCDPQATALLAFPLASGRHCVAVTLMAGTEHTARGGLRVYTHFALLTPPAYIRLGANPVRVHAGLIDALGTEPVLNPNPRLEQLRLPVAPPHEAGAARFKTPLPAETDIPESTQGNTDQADVAAQVCLDLFEGQRVLVVGARDEHDLLSRVLVSLPLAVRRNLAVSAGLKYAPARELKLCLTAHHEGETRRIVRGRNIRLLDVDAVPPRSPSAYDPWLNLTSRWLKAGRTADLERLTTSISRDVSPEALARIATVASAVDLAKAPGIPQCADPTGEHVRLVAEGAIETELLENTIKTPSPQGPPHAACHLRTPSQS